MGGEKCLLFGDRIIKVKMDLGIWIGMSQVIKNSKIYLKLQDVYSLHARDTLNGVWANEFFQPLNDQ